MRPMRRLALPLAALLAVGAVAACSSDSDSSSDTTAAPTGATPSPTSGTSAATTPDELPPPDDATFVGQARVVNLYVDDAGETQDIDVWAQQSFTNGPVLLAEGIAFGEASDYFASPEGQSIIFTPAGSGNGGEELGGMFTPSDDEQITAVFEWDGTGPSVPNDWEHDASGSTDVEEAPDSGGLVILRAGQLDAHQETLTSAGLGASFYVGDGSGTCPHQRVEDEGFSASILGGTQPVYLDLDAGTATLTFHEWPSADSCATDPLFDLDVDVPEGGATVVYLYTPDGETIESLQLPIG